MILNYFKIAWRNLSKNKVFTIINIIGLTIGLSASFVIGLMVFYDSTFDTFHKDGDRVYRVVTDFSSPKGPFYNPGVTLALEDAISENSNFETVCGFSRFNAFKVENDNTDKKINPSDFSIFTSQNYFEVFNYNFIAGSAQNVLSKPNQIILSEKRAEIYFPSLLPEEIIGKTLKYNDSINATVTGIVEPFKGRTDMVFDEFLSLGTAFQTDLRASLIDKKWNSTSSSNQLFVKINESANVNVIKEYLVDIAEAHQDEESKKYGQSRLFNLQPLTDIHFNENYGIYDYSKAQANKQLLLNLGIVALFLLLLGCINFINLNTAQASKRAKEIGIRKTLGSSKKQLIAQFMGETFMLTLFSTIISLLLTYWLIDIFSDFIPEGLSFELLKSPLVIFGIILIMLTVTFLSGYYPAMILSRFNAISVLKSKTNIGNSKVKFRKVLTVFQFTIAQVFIIATLLVGKQIHFLLNKDMGFKTEAITSFRTPRNINSPSKKAILIDQLRAIPEIKSISIGGSPPASFSEHSIGATYIDGEKEINSDLQFVYGDTKYFDLFNLKLLAGRTHRNDTIRELVINETYRKFLGFKEPEDAIGENVVIDDVNVPIVGVMDDFYQRSLKSEVKSMALIGDWWYKQWSQFHSIHLELQEQEVGNWSATIAKIEDAYKTNYPESSLRLRFLDQTIQRFYNREQNISKLLNWTTGLSILISCLGLLGLVIYTTERRIKEIGVRKVLGASLLQINVLLCKEFLALVIIAFLIASPIAWYGINNWLQDFAYKVNISVWIFLLSGMAMVFFALVVISAKTIQSANANPVDSLKME